MDEVVITKDMIMKKVAERMKEEADEKERKNLECRRERERERERVIECVAKDLECRRERERVVECVAKDLRLFFSDCKKLMFDQRVTKITGVIYHKIEQYVLDANLIEVAWGKVTKEENLGFQLLCFNSSMESHVSGLRVKNKYTDPEIVYDSWIKA